MSNQRFVFVGGPRTGKTTAAADVGLPVRHTDDTMHLEWSAASAEVATWFDAPGPWVIEGVSAPRALRKWLAAHPEGKPCDVVRMFTVQRVQLTSGQATMTKGVATVWREIEPELRRRGVLIEMA